MSPVRFVFASLLALGPPLGAAAQTIDGSPAVSAPPGVAGPPHRAGKALSTLPAAKMQPLPKPTAADRAEKRQIDHDLHICVGC